MFANPGHELVRDRHRGQPSLAHERPIVELLRLLYLGQRHGLFKSRGKLQINDRRLGVLRIVARSRAYARDADHRRHPTAVIDEYFVARLHRTDRADCLRIGDPVPDGLVVALEIVDGVGSRLALGKKVVHCLSPSTGWFQLQPRLCNGYHAFRCWHFASRVKVRPMANRQTRNQLVPVDSVSPEERQQDRGPFADLYHHLLTSSWPLLLAQISAGFFAINALFAVAYYLDGGI